jgi:tRNA-binding EMAP/Myf-like protein
VVANLKARKMAGFNSEGMVLCASSPVRYFFVFYTDIFFFVC